MTTQTSHPSIVARSAEAAHVWYREAATELGTDDLHDAAQVAVLAILPASIRPLFAPQV